MKIFFLLLCAVFCAPVRMTASAEAPAPQYAVAATESVWFYSEPNPESGLFLLPKSYYVCVLTEGAEYCAVRYLEDVSPYKSVTGYCKREQLTYVDFVPARPYLKKEIKVTYTLSGSTPNTMGNGSFLKFEKSFCYYGTSYSGTTKFYYVLSDGVFDYIPALEEIAYELNTDYLVTDTFTPTEEGKEESTSPSAWQIAAICAVAICAVLLAVFLVRGKKAPASEEDF